MCVYANNVRFTTTDFCLHNTGLKQRIYVASRASRRCFDRQRDKTVKSESRSDLKQSTFAARWQASADWYPSAQFSRFFGGLPGRFGCGSRTASRMCFGKCCEMRSTNLWAVFQRTGSHYARTQIGKSNCFWIGWGSGLSVGWTLCSYDIQLAPRQRDSLVGQHHSLFSPVSRSYCQARAHGAWVGKASAFHVVLVDRSWRNSQEANPGIRSLPRCRKVQSAHLQQSLGSRFE